MTFLLTVKLVPLKRSARGLKFNNIPIPISKKRVAGKILPQSRVN